MKILGVIPARGGSKRLPLKNIAALGGVPLIWWTIEAARKSGVFSMLVTSTDDPLIAKTARSNGCRTVARPADLATDEAQSLDVLVDAYRRVRSAFDALVLLQPTSPFRSAQDICDAVLAMECGSNSVVSVRPDGSVNGAIYGVRTKLALAGTLYNEASALIRMPLERSLDIDTAEDLAKARALIGESAHDPAYARPEANRGGSAQRRRSRAG